MWIPVREPLPSSQLVVKVMDEDNIQDECAGSLLFDLKELLQKEK